ncbi:MAG: hypothetical protein WCX61_05400 [Candidatus Peribacteraceae bacterium]|jgi:hypothetical protein
MHYTITIGTERFVTGTVDFAESILRSPSVCGFYPEAQERCAALRNVPRGVIARLLSMHGGHANGRSVSVAIPKVNDVTVTIESTAGPHRGMFG